MNATLPKPLREQPHVVAQFTAALSRPDAVVTDAATLAEAGRDYWGFGGTPGLLLRPGTREEVVAVVRIAAEHSNSPTPATPPTSTRSCSSTSTAPANRSSATPKSSNNSCAAPPWS